MALSGRIFGFSSWSMLMPRALEGVAAVALLYAAIKRSSTSSASGAELARNPEPAQSRALGPTAFSLSISDAKRRILAGLVTVTSLSGGRCGRVTIASSRCGPRGMRCM